MSFAELGLDERLLQAVVQCGFTSPTEIQRLAIPVALTGRDVMASAQTGTGKTAAFVLPALQRLLEPSTGPGRGPRVLVLTPTRELATQVSNSVRDFGQKMRLRSGSVVGGEPYGPQLKLLGAPLDFLIATPGRLIDHLERGRVDLSRLELLVLDEADRMLDMGFIDDVQLIASRAPAERQTLLFSATLEGRVRQVADTLLHEPERIQVAGVKVRHESIEQRLMLVDDINHKHALLDHLLADDALGQCVVFTATKRAADALAIKLNDDGHASAPLHGDMHQRQRERTVTRMKRGLVKVLVATDVAARGLDIKGLSHVINFDLPMQAEDYVHRIGRTGRAGALGIAISLVGPQDRGMLSRIERLTGQRLERSVVPGLEPKLAERRPEAKRDGRRPGGGPGAGRGRPSGNRPWDKSPARRANPRSTGTRSD